MLNKNNNEFKILLVTLFCLFFIVLSCNAQTSKVGNFPKKPITVIFCYQPGGGSDMTLRPLIAVAQDHLGVSMIASSITGGAGTIGINACVRAKPDGYTLVLGTPTPLFIKPKTENLPYTLNDLEPVALVLAEKMILIVNSDAPYNNLDEFLEYAKTNELKIGLPGLWTINHVTIASLARKAGVKFIYVPYSGAGPSAMALLGKHIDASVGQPSEVLELVESGDLKVIAIFDKERAKIFPNVPTATEQGYNVVGKLMQGIFAPKGVPEEILDYLSKKIGEMTNDKSYKKMTEAMGLVTGYMDREHFKEFVKETDRMFEETLVAEGLVK